MEINNNKKNNDIYDYTAKYLGNNDVAGGNRLAVFDDCAVGKAINDLFDYRYDVAINPVSTNMYDYDAVVARETIIYDDATKLRSRLNYLYHLLALEGVIGVSFKVKSGVLDLKTLQTLIDTETNMRICDYREIPRVENNGIVDIQLILKAA